MTPLSPTAEPVAVAASLLRAVAANHLYIADLDAIQGRGDNLKALRDIRTALPDVELWVDGGFSDEAAIRPLIEGRIGRPVIGSESQQDSGFLDRRGDEAILSLDFRGDEPLVTGHTIHAALDPRGRPCRLPDGVRDLLG